MIFYSTGKGSYLKGKGIPIDIDTNGTTVDVLLQRGFIVRTLEELNEVEKPIEPSEQLSLITDIEVVNETIKKERKKRETKKAVKTRQKRSTNR